MEDAATTSSLVLHAGSEDDLVGAAADSLALSVRSVRSASATLDALAGADVTCLVCEAELPTGKGMDLLAEVGANHPSLPVLFVTDDASLGEAALAAGATDIFVGHDGVDGERLLSRRLRNVLASATGERADANEAAVGLLHSMYDVTTNQDSSYTEKVDRLLRLGCEAFGLSNGFLTRIEGGEPDGTQTIVQARGAHELLQPGESCPLSEAYCRKTIDTDGLLAVSNAAADGWADDPAYETFGLGCYIGGKVVVGGELHGTVCFADTEPRDRPFTELERTAVRLMNEWVSYELDRRQARGELELKNRAMDEAPVGILISDATRPDNPAVYVNDQFSEMTGYPPSEVLDRNCRFLQGEGTQSEPVAELREGIDAERPVSVELRNYRRDGTEFWNRVTVAPIEDSDGEVTHFVGFQEDVTARKEHELDLKLRNRAISAAPIGITIHDATARPWPVTYANGAFETLTGYDLAALDGGGLWDLCGAETDTERIEALETAFERGRSASDDVLLYRRDDSPFWARVSIAPVTGEDGSVSYAVGFLEDVTETKRHAETIERRLDEFGDVLAAELQTPLREAQSRLSADPEALSSEDLRAAVDAVEQTDRLIDDLTAVHSFSVKSRELFETDADEGA